MVPCRCKRNMNVFTTIYMKDINSLWWGEFCVMNMATIQLKVMIKCMVTAWYLVLPIWGTLCYLYQVHCVAYMSYVVLPIWGTLCCLYQVCCVAYIRLIYQASWCCALDWHNILDFERWQWNGENCELVSKPTYFLNLWCRSFGSLFNTLNTFMNDFTAKHFRIGNNIKNKIVNCCNQEWTHSYYSF